MIIVTIALLMSSCMLAETHWQYLPFDTAMQKESSPQAISATERIIGIDGNMLYNFFKNQYETQSKALNNTENNLKIPKIFHQSWLGSPLPETFKALQQTWIEQHLGRDWI